MLAQQGKGKGYSSNGKNLVWPLPGSKAYGKFGQRMEMDGVDLTDFQHFLLL